MTGAQHDPTTAPAPAQVGGGVLVIDKPPGMTSHDVVQRLRKVLRTRAIGHAGTLDPMATGVLVLALGEATKLVPWLTAHDKAYDATVALGVETDTLDAEGTEVGRSAPSRALLDALGEASAGVPGKLLRGALEAELARTLQRPPAHSAIRIGGQRSYDLARRGETVELAPRDVRLRRIAIVGCRVAPPSLDLSIEVSKGYYVRALARDLAESLGTLGHLTALRRTRSGCFDVGEAVALDAPTPELLARLQPLAGAAARALPVARLTEAGVRAARQGRPVAVCDMDGAGAGDSAWLSPEGDLVAIGALGEDGRGRVIRGMAQPPRPRVA
jgi:tRNA pseudouridine55 synthase